MSYFYKWTNIILDTQPGPTLPAGMSRRGIILGNILLGYHEAKAGIKANPHTHPNDQIAILIKGKLLMEIDGETHTMEPGEFAYIPKNIMHRVQTFDEDAIVLDIFYPIRQDIAKRLEELGKGEKK